jgi:hypothetical protein
LERIVVWASPGHFRVSGTALQVVPIAGARNVIGDFAAKHLIATDAVAAGTTILIEGHCELAGMTYTVACCGIASPL